MNKFIPAFLVPLGVLAACIQAAHAQPIVSKADISSVDSGDKETVLGDITTDALRASTNADVAFIPAAALREENLSKSGLTSEQIAGVLVATTAPANAYVTLRLKGKQILAALERSVSHLPESYDGFLQVSGVKVVYDVTKPEGSRIVSVTFSDGTSLSPDSQYIAAMTEPLGIGSMGYFQAWNQSDIATTSNDSLATVLTNYVISHQPIDQQTDGRLTSQ